VHVGIDIHMDINDANSILNGAGGHPFSASMWGDDSPNSEQGLFNFPAPTDSDDAADESPV
jgi:hypothetical protein